MKKILFILCFSAIIVSCKKDNTTEETPNTAPSVPTLIHPANNLFCLDNLISFEWNSSTDPEKDDIDYVVEVSKHISFTTIEATFTKKGISHLLSLDEGVSYFWRIKAVDNKGASSAYSNVNNFYTEGTVTNHIPYAPTLISPQLNEITNNNTLLEWSAKDEDDNDTLSFDLYLGTDRTNLEIKAQNISSTSYTINDLTNNQEYFWKIVVKDNKNGQAIGQIWNFKTP